MSLISKIFSELAPRGVTRSAPLLFQHQQPAMSQLLQHPLFAMDPFTSAWSPFEPRQPAIDVHENETAYEVLVEVPGVPRDKVSCEVVNDDTLLITGQYERSSPSSAQPSIADSTASGGPHDASTASPATSSANADQSLCIAITFWASERLAGSFRRSVTFPTHVDASNVKASLADGILRVHVPKHESAARRTKVPIAASL
ncbi:HSP20-like chaperone [Entophlyctis helioformis]|nr:HSP20-like chaperone [Entophlyctis helioformis]